MNATSDRFWCGNGYYGHTESMTEHSLLGFVTCMNPVNDDGQRWRGCHFMCGAPVCSEEFNTSMEASRWVRDNVDFVLNLEGQS